MDGATTPLVRIGRFSIDRVTEMSGPGFAPDYLFESFNPAVFDEDPVTAGAAALDPVTGRLISTIQSWVVRDGEHVVVIDTGAGNGKERAFPGFGDRFHRLDGPFLARLTAIGVAPEDVTHVLITHLHMDHVGWNTVWRDGAWAPTFPNARYVFGRDDMARTLSPGLLAGGGMSAEVARDSILPVVDAGLVDPAWPGFSPVPGLTFEAAPGHTSDQSAIRLTSDGRTGLFTADVFHSPLQVIRPEWSSRFCTDPAAAKQTRQRILGQAATDGTLLFPAHFAAPSCGWVVRRDRGYAFVPLDAAGGPEATAVN